MTLTGKQKAYLRGLGHHLNPVVQVGREGVSAAVVYKVGIELDNHELIKMKVGEGCLDPADEVGAAVAEQAGAELVQVIGRTVLLYRRRKKEPTIVLPKAAKVTPIA